MEYLVRLPSSALGAIAETPKNVARNLKQAHVMGFVRFLTKEFASSVLPTRTNVSYQYWRAADSSYGSPPLIELHLWIPIRHNPIILEHRGSCAVQSEVLLALFTMAISSYNTRIIPAICWARYHMHRDCVRTRTPPALCCMENASASRPPHGPILP